MAEYIITINECRLYVVKIRLYVWKTFVYYGLQTGLKCTTI